LVFLCMSLLLVSESSSDTMVVYGLINLMFVWLVASALIVKYSYYVCESSQSMSATSIASQSLSIYVSYVFDSQPITAIILLALQPTSSHSVVGRWSRVLSCCHPSVFTCWMTSSMVSFVQSVVSRSVGQSSISVYLIDYVVVVAISAVSQSVMYPSVCTCWMTSSMLSLVQSVVSRSVIHQCALDGLRRHMWCVLRSSTCLRL
jgi:hypothetical protein